MKLFTYAGNTHALQTLIVARYNGVDIQLPQFEMGKDNKTKEFLAKSPMGKVPVLEVAEGCICEAAAIARYVARTRADTNMYGSTFFEAGLVDQWIEFAKNELDLPVGMWIYPILGFISEDAKNTSQAKTELAAALQVLQAYLVSHTFLAGEGIAAADVVVACSLLNAFKLVLTAEYLAPFPSVVRWFKTCANQPEFTAEYLAPFPSVVRWFKTCVNQPEFTAVIGETKLAAPTPAAAPAPAAEKKEKPPKEEKKPTEKKEKKAEDPEAEPKKEEKKAEDP